MSRKVDGRGGGVERTHTTIRSESSSQDFLRVTYESSLGTSLGDLKRATREWYTDFLHISSPHALLSLVP